MPTYYLGSTNADLSAGADFNKYLEGATESSGSIAISIAKGATETSCAYTRANNPSNADWQTGTITVEIYVTTGNQYIYGSVQAHRINSSGTIQESSTATAEQNLIDNNTLYTFTISSKDWTAGNESDRLRIDYIIRNSRTQTAQSVTIRTGTADTEVTTSIKVTESVAGTIGATASLPTTCKLSAGVKLVGVVGEAASLSGHVEYSNYIRGRTDSVSNLPTAKLSNDAILRLSTFGGQASISGHLEYYNYISGSTSGVSGTSSPPVIHGKFRGPFPFFAGGLSATPPTKTISGTSSAVSSVSGKIIRIKPIAGATGGVSGLSGVLKEFKKIVGSFAGDSTLSGINKSDIKLIGSFAGDSTLSGINKSVVLVIGSTTGTATPTAILKRFRKVIGSTAGVSGLSGINKSLLKLVSIAIAASSTFAALPKISCRMQGSSNAIASPSGLAKGTLYLRSTISSEAGVSGSILGGPVELLSTIQALSGLSGVNTSTIKLVGPIIASSSISGVNKSTVNVSGSIDSSALISGPLTGYANVIGLISGVSAYAGIVAGFAKLDGLVEAASVVSASLYVPKKIGFTSPNMHWLGGRAGAKVSYPIAGSISAQSGASAVLNNYAYISGLSESVSGIVGEFKSGVKVDGSIASVSEFASVLKFFVRFAGSVNATSSVVAVLRSDVPILGIAEEQSSFICDLRATSRVWGSSSITSDVLGALKATTLIRGSSSAISNVATIFRSGVKLVGSFGATSAVSGIAHADTKLISTVSLQSNVTGIYRSDVKVASTTSGSGSLSGVVKSTLRLPVTVAETSTVSGINKSDVKLIGSSAGTSDVRAILIVLSQGLGGITYGKAALGASLTRYKRVIGTSASTSSISGAIRYEVPIAGIISGDFNSTAVASEFVRIAGSSSGVAAPTAAIRYDVLVSGATAGDSSLSGTLLPIAGLSGISQSSSTVSALLRATATLVAHSDGVSDVSGLEKVDVKLISGLAGTSALSGTVVTTAQESLEGVISPFTTFSGILKATCLLAASSNVDSTFVGSIRYTVPIAGSFAGSPSVSANIYPTVKLVSTVAGQSSITGIARADAKLISGSSIVSSFSGYLKSDVKLQSTVSDSLTIEAILFTSKDLRSQVSGSSSVSGSLYIIADLVGSIAPDSNVSGSIKYNVLISSITSAISSCTADLQIYALVDFFGTIAETATLGANLFPGVTVRGQTNPTLLAVGSLTVNITTYKQNYYLSNEVSDLVAGHEFNNELHTVPSSSGTITVSVPASETKVGYGFTDIEIPGNSDWEHGIVEVKLYVIASNANIYAKVSVSRVSSSGMLLETSGYTTEKHLRHSGLYVFHVNRDWSAGSIGDRLRVSYSFRNIDSSAWQSITIRTENNDARITTTIKRYILLRGIVNPVASLSTTCVAVALCSGTISGSLDISPRPSVITPIRGALSESCSLVAALFVVRPMPIAGQTDVVSSVDSTLRKRFDIFGVLSNYSIIDAYLRSDVDLVGSIDANAAFKKGIEGSITSDSTIAGILKGRSKLISTTAGDSIVGGYLRADVDLVGVINVNAAFKKGVEGTVNSVSSVSGTLKVTAGMIGLSSPISSLTAIEHSTLRLKDVLIHAQTTVVGARPTGTIGVRGAVRGESSVPDAGLRWYVKTIGYMHVRSYVNGDTHSDTKIIGQIDAKSTLDNDRIREWVKIVGTVNVLSDSSTSLKKIVKTAGNSSAITSASSSINRLRKIETSINVQTGTDGYIHSGVVLSGSSSPTSYASAYDLSVPEIIDILGSIVATSCVEGKKPKQRFTARRHLIHYSPPDHPFVQTLMEEELVNNTRRKYIG